MRIQWQREKSYPFQEMNTLIFPLISQLSQLRQGNVQGIVVYEYIYIKQTEKRMTDVQDNTTICSTKIYPFPLLISLFYGNVPIAPVMGHGGIILKDKKRVLKALLWPSHTPKRTEVNTNVTEIRADDPWH